MTATEEFILDWGEKYLKAERSVRKQISDAIEK